MLHLKIPAKCILRVVFSTSIFLQDCPHEYSFTKMTHISCTSTHTHTQTLHASSLHLHWGFVWEFRYFFSPSNPSFIWPALMMCVVVLSHPHLSHSSFSSLAASRYLPLLTASVRGDNSSTGSCLPPSILNFSLPVWMTYFAQTVYASFLYPCQRHPPPPFSCLFWCIFLFQVACVFFLFFPWLLIFWACAFVLTRLVSDGGSSWLSMWLKAGKDTLFWGLFLVVFYFIFYLFIYFLHF